MRSATVGMGGSIKLAAVIDGYVINVELHPHGADTGTVARTVAALQGTMQALETGTWPNHKLTDTPNRLTLGEP